jgi:hypothetical protein
MSISKQQDNIPVIIIVGLLAFLLGLGGYFFFVKKGQTSQVSIPNLPVITQGAQLGTPSPTLIPTSTTGDSETVTQNGITMTVSPTHGPAGTKVNVHIVGIIPNPNAPYATVSLLAINGLGKDSDTSEYTFNSTKIQNATYDTIYIIPMTVMTSKPGDQNYTTEAPIGIGNGNITFSYQHPTLHDISIKVPFTVTSN